jgi:hypothetical protein
MRALPLNSLNTRFRPHNTPARQRRAHPRNVYTNHRTQNAFFSNSPRVFLAKLRRTTIHRDQYPIALHPHTTTVIKHHIVFGASPITRVEIREQGT